jgi:methylglyoxal synthase
MSHIALIAHDRMKPVLTEFLRQRKDWLWGRNFVATGLTADFLEHGLDLNVNHLQPGRSGGFVQLTEMAAKGDLSLVLFFRDPEIEQDYESEVSGFVKTCIRENIPRASNPASAELLIVGLIKMEASRKS